MSFALSLAFLLGSASAERGYNRSRTNVAIPKFAGSPSARGPTARIVGGAPP